MARTDSSSPQKRKEEGLLSCWGRLKLKLPWTKRRISSSSNNTTTLTRLRRRLGWSNIAAAFNRMNSQPRPVGGFRYDPSSYAQNFDEGCWHDDNEDGIYRGFSSRVAPPQSRSLQDHK